MIAAAILARLVAAQEPGAAPEASAVDAAPAGEPPAPTPPASAEPATPTAARTAPDAPVSPAAAPLTPIEDTGVASAPPPPRRVHRRRSATERWIRTQVPDHLEKPGPFRVEWWQWGGFSIVLLLSAGLGQLARRTMAGAFGQLARANPTLWDAQLLKRSRRALDVAWGLGAAALLSTFLYLRDPAAVLVNEGLHIGLLLALLWFAARAADIAGDAVTRNARQQGNAGAASVVPLVVHATKIALLALAVVTVLSTLGYPVTSLLAGLGIGGLALALAAQKTAENVFGSVSIGIDQPFRVGDLVKIEDVFGVVERIGLRSTSVRTPERTLVTWPNGKLAELRVENHSARDRLRFFAVLPVALDAPRERLAEVMSAIEARLHAEPQLWPGEATARVVRISAVAIELEVCAWLELEPDAFAVRRNGLLVDILDILEHAGLRLTRPLVEPAPR